MLKRLFGKKDSPDPEKINAEAFEEVSQWIDAQVALGRSRQAIANDLLQEATKIDHQPVKSRSAKDFARQIALDSFYRELDAPFYPRNEKGSELEKEGRIDEAVLQYEANVFDEFIGSYPYERLRIIYSKKKDWANAIRICQAAIDCTNPTETKKKKYQDWIIKYGQRLNKGD